MIYYQDIIQVEPGQMDRYMKAFEEKALPALLDRGQHPVGFFRVVPGTGNYNEVIFINSIESWSRWGRDVLTTEGHPNREEWHPGIRSWAEQAFDYRKRWVKNFYTAAPFAPTYEQLQRRNKTGSTFIHTMYRVTPGHMSDFLTFAEKELVPSCQNQGMELIGFWQIFPGTGPSNQVVELWAVEHWDHWEEVVKAQRADGTFRGVMRMALEFRPEWVDRILLPAPWAMLQ
ncbi:MAG: NIPSNAP family protein [Dehalococcoidia bacterium]